MNTEKLYPELYQVKIKQTITPIRFKANKYPYYFKNNCCRG